MQKLPISACIVSNPLGQDGDLQRSKSLRLADNVSNPLGQDGDFTEHMTEQQRKDVSNPLGQDGDPCCDCIKPVSHSAFNVLVEQN